MSNDLLTAVASALDDVDPRDVRRVGDRAVWHLDEPGWFARSGRSRREAIERCKHRMLALFAESERAYLFHPEDPRLKKAIGSWIPGLAKTTRLPRTIDLDDPGTKFWLFSLGNWVVYIAPAPIEASGSGPDPFRADADHLLTFMARVGIIALISSFPDDVSWVIAVAGERPLA